MNNNTTLDFNLSASVRGATSLSGCSRDAVGASTPPGLDLAPLSFDSAPQGCLQEGEYLRSACCSCAGTSWGAHSDNFLLLAGPGSKKEKGWREGGREGGREVVMQ